MSYRRILTCSRDQFIEAMKKDTSKANNFAKTFVAKADMQNIWPQCFGVFFDDKLAGAQITTIGKNKPHTANLQLLHTFPEFRGRSVARELTEFSLSLAISFNAGYWRVSSEKEAIPFYEKVGIKFIGEQKSGCLMTMFAVDRNTTFQNSNPNPYDENIRKQVFRKGKGGCTRIIDTRFLESPLYET